MNLEERNRFLVEVMGYTYIGSAGDGVIIIRFPEFEQEHFYPWDYFGLLWEWAVAQEWWDKFLYFSSDTLPWNPSTIHTHKINPGEFADALYNFCNP